MGALGLVTCLGLWLVHASGVPTAASFEPGDTYIPGGLYTATILSLVLAFVITIASDYILGATAGAAFAVGFVIGLAIFLWNIPWSALDRGSGQMFSLAMWWVPPILGTVAHVSKNALNEFRH